MKTTITIELTAIASILAFSLRENREADHRATCAAYQVIMNENDYANACDMARGINDCIAGVYDKFYRYNRLDDGAAYDAGWTWQNATTQNENVQFIECESIA